MTLLSRKSSYLAYISKGCNHISNRIIKEDNNNWVIECVNCYQRKTIGKKIGQNDLNKHNEQRLYDWGFKCPCGTYWNNLNLMKAHIRKKRCCNIEEAVDSYISERRRTLGYSGKKTPIIILNFR